MMTTTQIAQFLDSLNTRTVTARYVRTTVYRAHTGRWPTWRAHVMSHQRGSIVVVAAWARCASEAQRFVVTTWSTREIRVSWESFATLDEALTRVHGLPVTAARVARTAKASNLRAG